MKYNFGYKLPNSKKWLLTDAFLTTFKEELDKIFKVYENEKNPTYWNTYAWIESTQGFYKALKNTSEKYNVTKAIYEYANKLPWEQSDIFDNEITVLMYKRGIIKEGTIKEMNNDMPTFEELKEWEENGEIEWTEETEHFNSYYVTRREWHFVEK